MYSNKGTEGKIECVVNGCADCVCKITESSPFCFLLNVFFADNELDTLKTKRLKNCPLPQTVIIRVSPHSYSDRKL